MQVKLRSSGDAVDFHECATLDELRELLAWLREAGAYSEEEDSNVPYLARQVVIPEVGRAHVEVIFQEEE